MPTTVKQWNNGVITARPYVPNGGVTYRQSQGGTCKTVHFIGVRQLTGKAERHLGTLKRDTTNVKSVKRERHRHSRQQYFISTSLPPFSGIITVVSACRDWHDVTAKRCGAKVETQNLASHKGGSNNKTSYLNMPQTAPATCNMKRNSSFLLPLHSPFTIFV